MILAAITTFCFLTLTPLILYDVWQRARGLAAFLFAYVVTYAAMAMAGVFAAHSEEFPPLAMNVMTVFLFVMIVLLLVPSIRKALLSIPTKRLVVWHWVRLPIGFVFLALAETEEIAPIVGRIVGWGDVTIGLWAIAYVASPKISRPLGTSIWNAAAFADILASLVIVTLTLAAPREALLNAQSMKVMSTFPFAMVPGFAVPLLLVTNYLIWRQVRIACHCCKRSALLQEDLPN